MRNILLLVLVFQLSILYSQKPCSLTPNLIDYDGNSYETVQIGNQCWMKENLRVTHYSNGSPIPNVVEPGKWSGTNCRTTGQYCFYGNTRNPTLQLVGALYSWKGAMGADEGSRRIESVRQGVCPDGWHMPNEIEWNTLFSVVGDKPGEKLKSRDKFWKDDGYGLDLYGFQARAVGARHFKGEDTAWGILANFWSSTDQGSESDKAMAISFSNGWGEVSKDYMHKNHGLSVRCIRD